MRHNILVSNLGYARDIDGSIMPHLTRNHRHLRTSHVIQKNSLNAYKDIIRATDPDICCLIEIDSGSFTSAGFDQFKYLSDPAYPYFDICSKYVSGGRLNNFLLTKGKSNAFMAKHKYKFERLYFSMGSKRLIYRIELEPGITLFFTHLSLKRAVRNHQLGELRLLADKEKGDVVIAGDFNILAGLDELKIFTGTEKYKLLNNPDEGTFTLFDKHYLLDICIVNSSLSSRTSLRIIDQPFSDHDALFISIDN